MDLQLVDPAEDDGQEKRPQSGLPAARQGRADGDRRLQRQSFDVAECLDVEGATEWRRLAPLPLPLASRGGVHFKQRILVVGGNTTGGSSTSATLALTPPTAGGLGQWVTLKATLPRPEYPRHITLWGNSLYLISKFLDLLKPCNPG